MNDDLLRLIANPYRLKPQTEQPKNTNSLENTISKMLYSEFKDTYVNSYLINRIKQVIQKEMNEYLIEMTVNNLPT